MKKILNTFWFKILILIVYTIIVVGVTVLIVKEEHKEVNASTQENVSENKSKDYENVTDTTEVEDSENKEKEDYIKNKIKVYDVKAAYMDSLLDGKVAGLTFRIKNNGNKTISKLQITFYYKDKNNQIIYDSSYTPIDSSNIYVGTGTEKELKPNYIWQLESDEFYPDKKVPKEWKEGKIEYKITDIQF